ncbi:late competence development ComFB family protein [Bacillus xiapuensis]|uniref:late competence development ComFB family protein n=1 Tax=Bacillus xiapuensis TaxID=2014075 RepID=UPI000C23EF58|nr:late competence development ComFB family protein [Bacillus xiapuensis]
MAVKNVMEDIVKEVIEEHLDHLHLSCRCERCLDDVLALSLNHLPAKYVVNDSRSPYIKAMYMVHTQEHANILTTITRASAKVSQNMHCQNQTDAEQ